MKLGIHIVAWNGKKYLRDLFASIASQSFLDARIRILDNASDDGTFEWINEYASRYFLEPLIIGKKENIGFACGHNELFSLAQEEYIFLVNQDTELQKDYIKNIIEYLDFHKNTASSTGILLALSSKKSDEWKAVDSFGLEVKKTRKVCDLIGGEIKSALAIKAMKPFEVFGVSGTLPIYRASALREVLLDGNMFDDSYISYKEDVDLAYRLRARGFDSFVIPKSIAYHDRTVSSRIDREKRLKINNVNSYRNHITTLIKNEYGSNFLKDCIRIIPYEIAKFAYLLINEPNVLKSWKQIFSDLPIILEKREQIKKMRRVSHKDIRRFFV